MSFFILKEKVKFKLPVTESALDASGFKFFKCVLIKKEGFRIFKAVRTSLWLILNVAFLNLSVYHRCKITCGFDTYLSVFKLIINAVVCFFYIGKTDKETEVSPCLFLDFTNSINKMPFMKFFPGNWNNTVNLQILLFINNASCNFITREWTTPGGQVTAILIGSDYQPKLCFYLLFILYIF